MYGWVGGSSGYGTVIECYSKGVMISNNRKGSVIGAQYSQNNNTLNNLYYLSTLNLGAVNGSDIESQNVIGISEDFNSLEEFIEWLQ